MMDDWDLVCIGVNANAPVDDADDSTSAAQKLAHRVRRVVPFIIAKAWS